MFLKTKRNDLTRPVMGTIFLVVVSPVISILADNPRASELLNHVGSSGRKYCQMCMIGVNDNIKATCT